MHRNRAVEAERALRAIRDELSHGSTANFEFIEQKFEEILGPDEEHDDSIERAEYNAHPECRE